VERLPPRFFRGLRFGLLAALLLWTGLALVFSATIRHAYVDGLDIALDWLCRVLDFDPRFLGVSLAAAVVLARCVARPCPARRSL
jgi:hypothetical protein